MTVPPTGKARILVVDDRAENLMALEAILSGLGHELVKACSGEEALKRLLVEDVALILLDVQMPGMDGFETAAHIKQRERTRDIPIIFLTAMDGESHLAFRGYAAGAVDYLAKPFDPWVLRAKVNVFVDLDERRRELARRTAELQSIMERLSFDRMAELADAAAEALEALTRVDGGDGEAVHQLRRAADAVDELRALFADVRAEPSRI